MVTGLNGFGYALPRLTSVGRNVSVKLITVIPMLVHSTSPSTSISIKDPVEASNTLNVTLSPVLQ